jgi:hypothetical protein
MSGGRKKFQNWRKNYEENHVTGIVRRRRISHRMLLLSTRMRHRGGGHHHHSVQREKSQVPQLHMQELPQRQ